MNILTDFENIPLALHHIPVSPLQRTLAIKRMLKNLNYNEIESKTGIEEAELRFLIEVHTGYAANIMHFANINKLSNEEAAKILKMDVSVLNEYLELLDD